MCLIRGTKLVEKEYFPDYNSIRVDRPSTHRGGGLLTLVKEDKVFQRATENYSPLLERLPIQIQLSRRRQLPLAPVKKPISSDYLALNNISVSPFT